MDLQTWFSIVFVLGFFSGMLACRLWARAYQIMSEIHHRNDKPRKRPNGGYA